MSVRLQLVKGWSGLRPCHIFTRNQVSHLLSQPRGHSLVVTFFHHISSFIGKRHQTYPITDWAVHTATLSTAERREKRKTNEAHSGRSRIKSRDIDVVIIEPPPMGRLRGIIAKRYTDLLSLYLRASLSLLGWYLLNSAVDLVNAADVCLRR